MDPNHRHQKPLPPSTRGMANLKANPMFDLQREKEKYTPYHPIDHPEGLIDISSSGNTVMSRSLREWADTKHEVLFDALKKGFDYSPSAGSRQLRRAIADFTTRYFKSVRTVNPDGVIASNGVSSLLSTLTYNICEAGEAVMFEVPNYGMFEADLTYQNETRIVQVTTENIVDRFSAQYAEQLIQTYEEAFEQASRDGLIIRAVLICNPCNPVGRCYSRASLMKIASFCGRHGLHLISDEIYALSGAYSADGLDEFTSILSLPDEQDINHQSFHILSGAAKDFGLGGIRLGWLITHNELVYKTVRRLGPTTWVTAISDAFLTTLLSDSKYIDEYVNALPKELNRFREYAIAALEDIGIPFEKANAGLFLWIDLSKWVAMIQAEANKASSEQGLRDPEMRLAEYLMKKGIYLQPGRAFFSEVPGKYRLVYTGNTKEVLSIAFRRLKKALSDLEGGQDV